MSAVPMDLRKNERFRAIWFVCCDYARSQEQSEDMAMAIYYALEALDRMVTS